MHASRGRATTGEVIMGCHGHDWRNGGGVSVSLSLINSRIGGDSVCCDGCVSKLALCGNMSLMNGVLADEVQDLTGEVPCRGNEISTRGQVREHAKEGRWSV